MNSGCTQFVTTKLPIPTEPEYPKVNRQDLQCLKPEVYKKLVKRDILKSSQIKALEEVIKANNGTTN